MLKENEINYTIFEASEAGVGQMIISGSLDCVR